MTNDERDKLLIKMSVQVEQINRKLDRDGNALYGTDQDPGNGLIQRVKAIEMGAKWSLAIAGVAGALIGFIVNVALRVWGGNR